jgi:hypothetical protein
MAKDKHPNQVIFAEHHELKSVEKLINRDLVE